jgi:transposase
MGAATPALFRPRSAQDFSACRAFVLPHIGQTNQRYKDFELILTAKERAMRTKVETASAEAEKRVRDIRRATRRQYSAEEKIRIVIAGLRGEDSIAELCRKEGINQNLYYRWSKDFLEAGKKRLAGDTAREATGDEVKDIQAQARQLKELVAELMIENRLLKKSVLGDGESDT